MAEKTNVPEIRFTGFTDPWEQCKFEDLLQTIPFKPFLKEPEQDGKYEVIQQGNEPIVGFAKGTPCNDYQDVVIFGDHTLSLYKPKNPFFVATDGVRIVKGKQDVDGYYLLPLLERYKPPSEGYKRYYSILADTDCLTTCNADEQKQIGSYFATLDHLITLHQRECDKLAQLKKLMLDKMFPKPGERFPEIRFAGFTDPWEQRKVADITAEIRGGGTPATSNSGYWDGNIPWIQSSDLADGKLFGLAPRKHISKAGLSNSATQLVAENSIAVVTRVGVGKLAFMPFSYATSQDFLSLCRLQTEPYFTVYALYQMLQGELQVVQGTSIKGMTKEDLLSKAITVPADQSEQKQIGAFFRELDNLITLHQRKLELLRNTKKSLLDRMFV